VLYLFFLISLCCRNASLRERKGEGAGENCIMRSFIVLHQILLGDQVKDGEMGGACSTHGGDEKCLQNFSRKN
jgi:hypothetical protein